MNRPCPVAITECPGIDSPILNLSSEAPDTLFFAGTAYTPFRPWGIPPLGGTTLYVAKDCFGIEYTTLSQEIADLLAQLHSDICQQDGTGGDSPLMFANDQQTATSRCENGTEFSYTVTAGLFVAQFTNRADGEAWKEAANARALAYAQQKASEMTDQFCISTPRFPSPTDGNDQPDPPIVDPPGIIAGMPHLQSEPGFVCLGDMLYPALNTYAVRGQNSQADYTFSVSDGALPPGVTLEKYDRNRAQLVGTPTTPGTYTYKIKAERTGMAWIFAEVQDTLSVFGLNNPNVAGGVTQIDDAQVGTAYSFQLTATGGTTPIVFTLVTVLPPGLTMDDTGLISGTPT